MPGSPVAVRAGTCLPLKKKKTKFSRQLAKKTFARAANAAMNWTPDNGRRKGRCMTFADRGST